MVIKVIIVYYLYGKYYNDWQTISIENQVN